MAKRMELPTSKAPGLEVCGSCRFSTIVSGSNFGECRRYPPPPMGEKVIVSPTGWCGEYKRADSVGPPKQPE